MSPEELRKLMHRFRLSSEKLGKAIGVHPVTVRRWRSGARHPGRSEAHRMMAFFRDLGGEPMPTIDPAKIEPAPIEHRITIEPRLIEPRVIEPRVDPLPRGRRAAPAKASIVEAINGLVAVLAPRRPADSEPRPVPAPATRPLPGSLFRQDEPGRLPSLRPSDSRGYRSNAARAAARTVFGAEGTALPVAAYRDA